MGPFSTDPISNSRQKKCKNECDYIIKSKCQPRKIPTLRIHRVVVINSTEHIHCNCRCIIKPHKKQTWPGKKLNYCNSFHLVRHVGKGMKYFPHSSAKSFIRFFGLLPGT